MSKAIIKAKITKAQRPDEEMWLLDSEMMVVRGEAIANLLEQILAAPYTIESLDRIRALTVLNLRMSTAALKKAAEGSVEPVKLPRKTG